eukprot:Rhum_TRINITY_DN14311_c9_g1::Rhum_TRINITY_DN14311_c9_g1_i1::g.83412::m.83412/K16264/czcD, zitB; cobalt-zinc-cadmium efflux system protein
MTTHDYQATDDDVLATRRLSIVEEPSARSEGVLATVACCCGKRMTKSSAVLLLSLCLFATITSAQVVGALIAHSQALLADCASMGLDTISYAGNLAAECFPQPDPRKQQRNYLVSAGLSYAALVGICLYFLVGGINTLISTDPDEEDVNPYIVFGFAVCGILFDVISIVPYCLHMKTAGESERVNLKSALSHVSADLLRSCATFVESILLWTTSLDGEKVDAAVTMIVTVTILLGIVHPLAHWTTEFLAYRNPGSSLPSRHRVELDNLSPRGDEGGRPLDVQIAAE